MSDLIEWRPMRTVNNIAETEVVLSQLVNGEHFGMFVPAASELGEELHGLGDDGYILHSCIPSVVGLALNMKLIDTHYSNVYRFGKTFLDKNSGVHLDLNADKTAKLNIHHTLGGQGMGIFMAATTNYVNYDSEADFWIQRAQAGEIVTRELKQGYTLKKFIKPVVEVAFVGPQDSIIFLEQPPLGFDVLPTPHMFWTFSDDRLSTAYVYGYKTAPTSIR